MNLGNPKLDVAFLFKKFLLKFIIISSKLIIIHQYKHICLMTIYIYQTTANVQIYLWYWILHSFCFFCCQAYFLNKLCSSSANLFLIYLVDLTHSLDPVHSNVYKTIMLPQFFVLVLLMIEFFPMKTLTKLMKQFWLLFFVIFFSLFHFLLAFKYV